MVKKRRGLDSVDFDEFCCAQEFHADGSKHYHVALKMTRSSAVPAAF